MSAVVVSYAIAVGVPAKIFSSVKGGWGAVETVIVTGGAGFIGCNFVRHMLAHTAARVVAFDKLTYAGCLQSLETVAQSPRFAFVQCDIGDRRAMEALFAEYQPTALVNFAAETHVDRSIDDAWPFVETNVVGTVVLLEVTRKFLSTLEPTQRSRFRFLHISTDEVYGTLGASDYFRETTPYAPNSPYAASKASADHFVHAYHTTYGVPTLITNCSNNYGPYQFPEKLIPLMLLNAIEGKPLPIYGDGQQVRDWLYVEDHCAAILLVLQHGRMGESYNIGGGGECTNLQVLERLCSLLEVVLPAADNPLLVRQGIARYDQLRTFVQDRPGHDRRYAIDATKIRQELGWAPRYGFDQGLAHTVHWYLDHLDWCDQVLTGKYGRQRLGLARTMRG
jgi:dTDP-glucose 4,6-dehydratase